MWYMLSLLEQIGIISTGVLTAMTLPVIAMAVGVYAASGSVEPEAVVAAMVAAIMMMAATSTSLVGTLIVNFWKNRVW